MGGGLAADPIWPRERDVDEGVSQLRRHNDAAKLCDVLCSDTQWQAHEPAWRHVAAAVATLQDKLFREDLTEVVVGLWRMVLTASVLTLPQGSPAASLPGAGVRHAAAELVSHCFAQGKRLTDHLAGEGDRSYEDLPEGDAFRVLRRTIDGASRTATDDALLVTKSVADLGFAENIHAAGCGGLVLQAAAPLHPIALCKPNLQFGSLPEELAFSDSLSPERSLARSPLKRDEGDADEMIPVSSEQQLLGMLGEMLDVDNSPASSPRGSADPLAPAGFDDARSQAVALLDRCSVVWSDGKLSRVDYVAQYRSGVVVAVEGQDRLAVAVMCTLLECLAGEGASARVSDLSGAWGHQLANDSVSSHTLQIVSTVASQLPHVSYRILSAMLPPIIARNAPRALHKFNVLMFVLNEHPEYVMRAWFLAALSVADVRTKQFVLLQLYRFANNPYIDFCLRREYRKTLGFLTGHREDGACASIRTSDNEAPDESLVAEIVAAMSVVQRSFTLRNVLDENNNEFFDYSRTMEMPPLHIHLPDAACTTTAATSSFSSTTPPPAEPDQPQRHSEGEESEDSVPAPAAELEAAGQQRQEPKEPKVLAVIRRRLGSMLRREGDAERGGVSSPVAQEANGGAAAAREAEARPPAVVEGSPPRSPVLSTKERSNDHNVDVLTNVLRDGVWAAEGNRYTKAHRWSNFLTQCFFDTADDSLSHFLEKPVAESANSVGPLCLFDLTEFPCASDAAHSLLLVLRFFPATSYPKVLRLWEDCFPLQSVAGLTPPHTPPISSYDLDERDQSIAKRLSGSFSLPTASLVNSGSFSKVLKGFTGKRERSYTDLFAVPVAVRQVEVGRSFAFFCGQEGALFTLVCQGDCRSVVAERGMCLSRLFVLHLLLLSLNMQGVDGDAPLRVRHTQVVGPRSHKTTLAKAYADMAAPVLPAGVLWLRTASQRDALTTRLVQLAQGGVPQPGGVGDEVSDFVSNVQAHQGLGKCCALLVLDGEGVAPTPQLIKAASLCGVSSVSCVSLRQHADLREAWAESAGMQLFPTPIFCSGLPDSDLRQVVQWRLTRHGGTDILTKALVTVHAVSQSTTHGHTLRSVMEIADRVADAEDEGAEAQTDVLLSEVLRWLHLLDNDEYIASRAQLRTRLRPVSAPLAKALEDRLRHTDPQEESRVQADIATSLRGKYHTALRSSLSSVKGFFTRGKLASDDGSADDCERAPSE